jgi:hypothetical protein
VVKIISNVKKWNSLDSDLGDAHHGISLAVSDETSQGWSLLGGYEMFRKLLLPAAACFVLAFSAGTANAQYYHHHHHHGYSNWGRGYGYGYPGYGYSSGYSGYTQPIYQQPVYQPTPYFIPAGYEGYGAGRRVRGWHAD